MFALVFFRSSNDRCVVFLHCSTSSIDQDRLEALQCFCKSSFEKQLDRTPEASACENVRNPVGLRSPDALDGSHVESVLRPEITGVFSLNLTVGFFLKFCFFECYDLSFCKYKAILCALGLKCFEPFLHDFQIVPEPYATDSTR